MDRQRLASEMHQGLEGMLGQVMDAGRKRVRSHSIPPASAVSGERRGGGWCPGASGRQSFASRARRRRGAPGLCGIVGAL
jgi:hypothetical protein